MSPTFARPVSCQSASFQLHNSVTHSTAQPIHRSRNWLISIAPSDSPAPAGMYTSMGYPVSCNIHLKDTSVSCSDASLYSEICKSVHGKMTMTELVDSRIRRPSAWFLHLSPASRV